MTLSTWFRAALVTGVVTAGMLGATAASAATSVNVRPSPSSGFSRPDAATASHGSLFVADAGSNTVTVLSASSGHVLATLSKSAYELDAPSALKVVLGDLYVANAAGNSVTELRASGKYSVVSVMSGTTYGFDDPIALATNGTTELFVLNATGSVVAIDLKSGAVAGVASGSAFGFNDPTSLTSLGPHLFVTNSGGNSVTEIDSSSMASPTILDKSKYKFDEPRGVIGDGNDLWVTNYAGGSLTEISAATDSLVQVVKNGYLPDPGPVAAGDGNLYTASPPGSSPMVTKVVPKDPASLPWMMCNTNGPYRFDNPQALAVYGGHLWVVSEGGGKGNTYGPGLTEMNAKSGALIRTIS
jgi:hypothetical protein